MTDFQSGFLLGESQVSATYAFTVDAMIPLAERVANTAVGHDPTLPEDQDFWSQVYHAAMNHLTWRAGVRRLAVGRPTGSHAAARQAAITALNDLELMAQVEEEV